MAQHKQLTWTELRVGLFVLAGAVLLAVVIFYVTGGGGWGPKYRLRAFLPEVDGLTLGAPVRVDGVDVGNVEKIAIAVPKPGAPLSKDRNIEVDLRIQKTFESYIRADSTAVLITEGLLGNRFVDIDRGYVGRVLENDEEIPGREEKALKQVVERSADLMDSLSSITKQASAVIADVRNGRGSLGKFMVDETAYNHLNNTLENVDHMMADIQAGKGTLGKLVADDEMYNRVDSIAGRVDNVLEAVQNQQGTLGKLVYDPGIHESAKTLIDNSNALIGDVRGGKGTLGKLATDDSLFAQYKQAGENLSSATAKLNSNEATIGKFFDDPKFYDNFTGLAGDMRLLVGDFRKDPKKFLHVKFSIF
ncbi:MAG TPA: MlaD family protein [Candidatus Acidoferrales bacterium]|jgi:phospholipid/cholesterol/gamma-HCH transport system substrate-binding protein|nr:MlaD family protein [Candidatus Acidoferrales bacterium]